MNGRRLILAGAWHQRRALLGVALGAALCAAILVAGLGVGDSLRAGLARQAQLSTGHARAALASGDRLFRATLADDLVQELDDDAATVAAALLLPGSGATPDGSARALGLQVLGVDAAFFALAPTPGAGASPAPGDALLGSALAARLGLAVGDTLVLRVQPPNSLSQELVLAQAEELAEPVRVRIAGEIDDEAWGRFSLVAGVGSPLNVVVDRAWLAAEVERPERANLLLAGGVELAALEAALARCWQLDDAELVLVEREERGELELRSPRVFLDDAVAEAAAALDDAPYAALTWFVNELVAGVDEDARRTPYSSVAALGGLRAGSVRPSFIPDDLAADEVVILDWLAEDLGVTVGDRLELGYWSLGPARKLVQARADFSVRAIVPLAEVEDPALLPDLPGLSDSDSCRDWEPGVDLDFSEIREQDELYWDEYKGTPKAYVSLGAGRELWRNRYGSLTHLRWPGGVRAEVEQALRARLDPAALGLAFRGTRDAGASTPATDFGGLFLALSFFLLTSALLLAGLLFAFAVDARAREIGLYYALGFPARRVRHLLLSEACLVALVGAIPGAFAGRPLCALVLGELRGAWSGALGGTELVLQVSSASFATGLIMAPALALFAARLALRGLAKRDATALLAGAPPTSSTPRAVGRARWVALFGLGAALALGIASRGASGAEQAGRFFGVGALVLVGGLACLRVLLARAAEPARGATTSMFALALANAGRRPGRSLATAGLLASGTFLLASISAFESGTPDDPWDRQAGTGGFALLAESSAPLPHELDDPLAREQLGFDPALFGGVSSVSLRVRAGDDASCLNLAVAREPRLVGVEARQLAERGAFRVAGALDAPDGVERANAWQLLDADWGTGVVPAIGDAASVRWTMHKALGDELAYTDERGAQFAVKVVATLTGSVLQGDLLIPDAAFRARFPGESGFRRFLIDAPRGPLEPLMAELSDVLSDVGFAARPSVERLAELSAVQNTYLAIFQALGALGLLLGTAGMLAVVLRTALERRRELAQLRALGFARMRVRSLLALEHSVLVVGGLGVGALASVVAIAPALLEGVASANTSSLYLGLATAGLGLLWAWMAATWATRGGLENALRDD